MDDIYAIINILMINILKENKHNYLTLSDL